MNMVIGDDCNATNVFVEDNDTRPKRPEVLKELHIGVDLALEYLELCRKHGVGSYIKPHLFKILFRHLTCFPDIRRDLSETSPRLPSQQYFDAMSSIVERIKHGLNGTDGIDRRKAIVNMTYMCRWYRRYYNPVVEAKRAKEKSESIESV
jgi:hypothetical protein